jgi:hypothetical protein
LLCVCKTYKKNLINLILSRRFHLFLFIVFSIQKTEDRPSAEDVLKKGIFAEMPLREKIHELEELKERDEELTKEIEKKNRLEGLCFCVSEICFRISEGV